MDQRTRDAWMIAGFAAAADLALVVCGFGFVSLLLDVEVVGDPDVGVLVAPVAVGASVLAVLVTLALRLRRPARMTATVLLTALGAWLTFFVVAVIARLVSSSDAALESLDFGIVTAVGWFGLLIPVCAALVALFAVLVARGRQGGRDRPRWPWERGEA